MHIQRLSKVLTSSALVGYVVFALTGFYVIFYLPYHFPPVQRLSSDSYAFGFNNSVAMGSIGMFLLLATLIQFLRRRHHDYKARVCFQEKFAEKASRMPRSDYWYMALLFLLFTTAVYGRAQVARFYGIDWESSYFLWRMKLMEIYGLRPYFDFHFEYGPALIYLPAYFHRLLSVWSVSQEASYYAFHYLVNLLSIYCILFLLDRSAMPVKYKRIAFLILGLASFAPYMGLNGVVVRFLFPYVSLVVIHQAMSKREEKPFGRRALKGFICVVLLTMINVSISAEIGLAFAIALVLYSAPLFRRDRRSFSRVMFPFALAMVVCLFLLPSPYYESVLSFSKGANNFPLIPAAHLLFYIVTLSLVVPELVVGPLLHRNTDSFLAMALGVLSMVLIPGAFGRCDPPHVFFYGFGACLLAFVQLANTGKKLFFGYALGYILIMMVGFQWSNSRVFGLSYETVVSKDMTHLVGSILGFEKERQMNRPKGTGSGGGGGGMVLAFAALDKYPRLGVPFANYNTDKRIENYLWMRAKIAPEYYMGAVGVYTETDLVRKLEDVSRQKFLLLPWKYWNLEEDSDTCQDRLQYIRRSFIYPVSLKCKGVPLNTHMEISKYIGSWYQMAEAVGEYVIVERVDP